MTVTAVNDEGILRILQSGGTWRDATPQEVVAEETSQGAAFAAQLGRNFGTGKNLLGTMSAPLAHRYRLPQETIQQHASELGEREQTFSALDAKYPNTSLAGQLILDPLNIPGGKIVSGMAATVSAAIRNAGKTTTKAIAAPAGDAAARAASETIETLGEAAFKAGANTAPDVDSVGAASILDWIPESIREPISRALNNILVPGELSADQRAILPLADEIGWKFLPGQREGNTFASELALSDPIVRDAFAFELDWNGAILNNRAAKALGRESGQDFGDNFLVETGEILSQEFEDIQNLIKPIKFSGDNNQLRKRLETLAGDYADELDLDPGNIASRDILRQLARDLDSIDGQTFQRLHSRWRDRAARERKGPDPEGNQIADLYLKAVDELDQAMIRSGNDEVLKTRYSTVRERWRMLKVMERPGVLDRQTGNFNPVVAANAFKREFGNQFRRQGGRSVSKATSELFDVVQVARRFKDTLGNSGSASRYALQDLTSPKKLAGKIAIREMLKRRIE